MKITRDDLIHRTKGELSRLFNAAKAERLRQPKQSPQRQEAEQALALIGEELARRP